MGDAMDVDGNGNDMLQPPSEGKPLPRLPRSESSLSYDSELFNVDLNHSFGQYYKIYGDRLSRLRGVVLDRARAFWLKNYDGPALVQDKVLNAITGHRCILIGALVKIMKKKPDIVTEYAKERSISPIPILDSYLSDDDELYLEDDTGRAHLVLDREQIKNSLPGSVVAVIGHGLVSGDFQVEKLFLPGCAPQTEPFPAGDSTSSGPLLALASGISFGENDSNLLHVQLFLDYVSGHLGGDELHTQQASISRIVLLGNTIVAGNDFHQMKNSQRFTVDKSEQSLTTIAQMADSWLSSLGYSVPVTMLPGSSDPTTYTLPQRPIPPFILPRSAKTPTFSLVPNPHIFEVDGVRILAHSGQILDALRMYTKGLNTLELVSLLLKCRHFAPFAPEHLSASPQEKDLFVLEETPHVIMFGNQEKFESLVFEGENNQKVRIICVPKFSKDHTVGLLNLKTMECQSMQFSAWDD
eukprot:TRINITY_DN1482_c7_g1_i1.p1 TRINITY_DN1482_c7_g1~~TRINITY_DN1482_c7_g1_i1.p1  ORF type:complete len:502 (-),score=113.77 TRINITY_DN1482_c7_g1_i1:107-1510(-)